MVSFGAIESRPGTATLDPRYWSPRLLTAVHLKYSAQLADEDVSIKPSNWVTDRPDFDQVKGARLAHRDLRHAQGANAFLVKADLTSADLGYADLRRADLRGAILTDARLSGANLTGAKLEGAVTSGCDFSDVIGLKK